MLSILLVVSSPRMGATDQVATFPDYASMRARVGALFNAEEYAEAGAVLTAHMDLFPDHLEANAFNLACAHVMLEEYDAAIEALNRAADQGIWYGKYFIQIELFTPLFEIPAFEKFLARNDAMRLVATPGCVQLDVVPPAGYDPGREYPLFLALHGGEGSLAEFKPVWHSPRLAREFVLAYVQSSIPSNTRSFSWYEPDDIRADIMEAYRQIDVTYSIDAERIYVGGYSAGAIATFCMAFDSALPVAGYLCLGPPIPEEILTVEKIEQAAGRGLRGAAIIGADDQFLPAARAMAATFDSLGHDFTMVILPDTGHVYPEDLPARLDEALISILD